MRGHEGMAKPRTLSPTVRKEHEGKIEHVGGTVGGLVKVGHLDQGWMRFLGHARSGQLRVKPRRRAHANGHKKLAQSWAKPKPKAKARAAARPRKAKARTVKRTVRRAPVRKARRPGKRKR